MLKIKPNKRNSGGMSLLEILVVVTLFAVLGIITARAVILTLQGSKKSENTVKVRTSVDYAMSIIERQLRNAAFISACPNPDPKIINYVDPAGTNTSFSCANDSNGNFYIASGSANLTGPDIQIGKCSFSCVVGTNNTPSIVDVKITANNSSSGGYQLSTVSAETQIQLRNY